MKLTLNKAFLSALLCGAMTIATPALAQLGGAGTVTSTPGGVAANAGVGSGRTGINGAVITPSATSAINRGATVAENTANAGAGTTKRTVNKAGDAATMNNKAQANAGASVSPGVSASGDVNSADIANNAASVNRSTQTGAGRLTRQAQANANAAETETTRQLNQQQGSVTTSGSADTTVRQ